MTWYRVLSPLIEESLKRGHDVECWHQSGAKTLGVNCPNLLKVPTFKAGVPVIIEYEKPEDIIQLVESKSPTVIIDLSPPKFPEIKRNKGGDNKNPFWLIADLPPGCCIHDIQSDEELFGCDAFAMINEHYLESSINYCLQDKMHLLASLKLQEADIGKEQTRWVAQRFMYQWGNAQARFVRERSVLVGNAALDHYPQIDREAIRKRLGIPKEQRVVVLLPFPFGYDQTAPWEQMFDRASLIKRLLWVFKANRFDYFFRAFYLRSKEDFIKALRRFVDHNDALLIGKLRHTMKPQPELGKYCHFLFADEGYYPHTAAELFSIADLVVGHYSSGVMEAVALGTPFLNVDIPGYPKKFYGDTCVSGLCNESWPGAVWSMSIESALHELPSESLDKFCISDSSREEYLRKFASWPLGRASAQVMDYLEKMSVSKIINSVDAHN